MYGVTLAGVDRSRAHIQSAPAPTTIDDSPRKEPLVGSHESGEIETLRATMEMSLAGALDPSAILTTALSLVGSKLDPLKASTTPSGVLCYPIVDSVSGCRAELWINPVVADRPNALSLRITLPRPAQPYILAGAVREEPETQITIFRDNDGTLRDFVIMTSLMISPETIDWKLPLGRGRMATGLSFRMNPRDPAQWNGQFAGLEDSTFTNWEAPITLVGATNGLTEHVRQFHELLLDLYAQVPH